MRIAIVTMQFPTQREAFASNEIKKLSQKGIMIDTYSLRFKSNQFNILIKERILERISCSHFNMVTIVQFIPLIFKRFREFLFLLRLIFKFHLLEFTELIKGLTLMPRHLQILDKLIKGNYNVVHLYWSHYPSIIGLAYKRFYPNRILTMSLAAYDLKMKYVGSQKLMPIADCVTTHSQVNVGKIDQINDKYKRLEVIYRGVPDYIAYTSMPKEEFMVSSVGALIKAKGFQDVIRAYDIIKNAYPGYYLNIYGKGPYDSELRNLIDRLQVKDISFKGHLSHCKLMNEIGSSSIFVFMSHDERLPNVVKEAIMNRCYCVVSKTVGIEELFAHPSESIVDIGDYKAAAQKVIEFIKNPEKYDKIIEDNFDHIRRNFSLDKTTDKYIQMWNSL